MLDLHKISGNKVYLTEEAVGEFLNIAYNESFIHNKVVPNSGIRNRPDYRNDKLKLIVEFDGYLHYSNVKCILRDRLKDKVYTKLGYTVIHIPYFIQLSSDIIKLLFNLDVNCIQIYKHGFIDKKAMLPADFCELGILRFKSDLVKFNIIYKDIVDSLIKKIEYSSVEEVLPPSLFYLIE